MTAKRLLIVDDDDEVNLFLYRLFERRGHSVMCATNAQAAWHFARTECIHLVILDLIFPEQDGLEILVRFKKEHPTIPVLVLTSLPVDHELVAQTLALGAKKCLRKSEPVLDLLQAADELLCEQGQGSLAE